MSRLRVVDGKLCVNSGQLQQDCGACSVTCDNPPDCYLAEFSGIGPGTVPEGVVTWRPSAGECEHTGPLVTVAGANTLIKTTTGGISQAFGGQDSGCLVTYRSTRFDGNGVGCGAFMPHLNSVQAGLDLSIFLGCRSDNTVGVVGVTLEGGPGVGGNGEPNANAGVIPILFLFALEDGEEPIPLGEPIPNQLQDLLDPPNFYNWGAGGFVTVTGLFNCDPVDPPASVMVACEEQVAAGEPEPDPIAVDLSANVSSLPSAELGDIRYYLTPQSTDDPPVSVTWVDEDCEQPVAGLYRAYKCRPNALGPDVVEYEPTFGVGQGSVAISTSDVPGPGCIHVTFYRPSADEGDGSLPLGLTVADTACSRGDIGWCPGDPGEPPDIIGDPNLLAPPPGGGLSRPRRAPCKPCEGRRAQMDPAARAAHDEQVRRSGCSGCGDPGAADLM